MRLRLQLAQRKHQFKHRNWADRFGLRFFRPESLHPSISEAHWPCPFSIEAEHGSRTLLKNSKRVSLLF